MTEMTKIVEAKVSKNANGRYDAVLYVDNEAVFVWQGGGPRDTPEGFGTGLAEALKAGNNLAECSVDIIPMKLSNEG